MCRTFYYLLSQITPKALKHFLQEIKKQVGLFLTLFYYRKGIRITLRRLDTSRIAREIIKPHGPPIKEASKANSMFHSVVFAPKAPA